MDFFKCYHGANFILLICIVVLMHSFEGFFHGEFLIVIASSFSLVLATHNTMYSNCCYIISTLICGIVISKDLHCSLHTSQHHSLEAISVHHIV